MDSWIILQFKYFGVLEHGGVFAAVDCLEWPPCRWGPVSRSRPSPPGPEPVRSRAVPEATPALAQPAPMVWV